MKRKETSEGRLLPTIASPHQLRRLEVDQLDRLAEELRERIIEVVSRRGGHLASNLGIAELTVALHYVFDFSRDRLLWDVGHQCYAHKILTGRGERFDTLRQAGGLSGFPSPDESEYDLFATGHAGVAISTAAGLAWADQAAGRNTKIVAVVGDASIVNGTALEAINNVALLRRQMLIILNDNSMAIDRTHGALAHVLDRIRLTGAYSDLKHSAESILERMPLGSEIRDTLRSLREGLKATIHGRQIFEPLGLNYYGPVDGHDIGGLIRLLRRLGNIDGPVILHVHTQKGRGCQYAVEDPCRFHSPSAYTVENGQAVFAQRERPTWTSAFSDALLAAGRREPDLVAITAAMPDGTGLVEFRKQFPDRCVDVGICESHAVAMAAGLARAGRRPVVAVYSTFLQRAFDQVFEEFALQKLPAVFCLDRAGLVGSDGAVHHGFADIAYLRVLPGVVLMAPADAPELAAALDFALTLDAPAAIRYPRDEVPDDLPGECPPFELGKARVLRNKKVVHTGAFSSIRHFKDEVKQVTQAQECGILLAGFESFQEGDVIECFSFEELPKAL
ncbi:MAG TPA: 1-deoxy-D-xylulose-5-phosphate synthase [Phycisphaerae bacterium]|nr:1-deoxy-D-xylulose-5-phosphate synthase [Phycisphaerae bacterium]